MSSAPDFVAQVDSVEDGSQSGPKRPFWSLNFDDEKSLLEWLNTELDYLKNQASDRHLNQRKNLAAYRGIQLSASDRTTRDEAASESSPARKSKNPRVVYNHMVDMVEQDVARMTEYRGAVACDPPSEDNEDRVVAETTEKLIEGFWDKVDIDDLMSDHSRRKRIFSEDYIWCLWNENLGPYDLDWVAQVFAKNGITGDVKKMKRGQVYDLFRKRVKEIPKIKVSEEIEIDKPMRMGDVEYKLWFSWNMFLQRKDTYAEVEYGFGTERQKVETVKARHPKKADKIGADSVSEAYDADTCEETPQAGECQVAHFYHRSTDELDQGRYIKFTRTAILINRPNPYLGKDYRAIFPWVRTVDIPTPGVLNGDATVTHGRGPQTVYNNLVSLKVRNRFLFSHPKWFMPKGAAKIESLGNGTSVVSYKGPVPPQLSQPAVSEGNESAMMQEAKGDLQQIMGVYGQSRGTPPAGITAAVALTFLDEQESKRANPGVAAHTRTLKALAERTAWLMADHYEDDDGRLEELLGRNEAANIRDFKMADLRSVGDIKIQSTSALPHQKSARLQHIIDIKKEFPGIIPQDMAVDLLGLGEIDKLRSTVTVAIRKAESENARMMNGVEIKAPESFEYHLAHYRIHMRQMNELSFVQLPEESQEAFKDHMMGHELEMMTLAQKNPQYLPMVMQEFPGFPYFYLPEEMAAPPPVDEVQGVLAGVPPPMAGGAPDPMMAAPPMAEPMAMPPGAEGQMPMPQGEMPGAEMLPPVGAPVA